MQNKKTYHILGAGVAGLMCARFIKKKDKEANVVLYEASNHLGGRCFSYEDEELGCRVDNATHVILGGNRCACALVGLKKLPYKTYFWNVKKDTLSRRAYNYRKHILKSMCNTKPEDVPQSLIKTIFWRLFPWSKKSLGVYFSKQDLSQRLINPQQIYPDEIHYNCKILQIESDGVRICRLYSNQGIIELKRDDIVISALDAAAYSRLFGTDKFDFNSIINVYFKTSQTIHLPRNVSYMGIVDGIADWVFVNDGIVSFSISDAESKDIDLKTLPQDLWKQFDTLRGVNSAFLPPHRLLVHKMATIRQDAFNNAKRPESALGGYLNLFLAGDWTMKNWPCCLEAAILSARRAVNTALKAQEKNF